MEVYNFSIFDITGSVYNSSIPKRRPNLKKNSIIQIARGPPSRAKSTLYLIDSSSEPRFLISSCCKGEVSAEKITPWEN